MPAGPPPAHILPRSLRLAGLFRLARITGTVHLGRETSPDDLTLEPAQLRPSCGGLFRAPPGSAEPLTLP